MITKTSPRTDPTRIWQISTTCWNNLEKSWCVAAKRCASYCGRRKAQL